MRYRDRLICVTCAFAYVACQTPQRNGDIESPQEFESADLQEGFEQAGPASIAAEIQEIKETLNGVEVDGQSQRVLESLLSQAETLLSLANDRYAEGQDERGDNYLQLATYMAQSATKLLDPEFMRSALSSVGPGAMVRDIYEASTGRSIVDGSPLSRVDRGVALVSFATGGVAASLFKQAKTADRITGVGSLLKDTALKSGESSDDMERVIQTADEIFANIDAVRTRLSEDDKFKFRTLSNYMTSEAIKARLQSLEQNATKFIGR